MTHHETAGPSSAADLVHRVPGLVEELTQGARAGQAALSKCRLPRTRYTNSLLRFRPRPYRYAGGSISTTDPTSFLDRSADAREKCRLK